MTDEELIETLGETSRTLSKLMGLGDGQYRLDRLLKIKQWAIDQQPVKVGDIVRITQQAIDRIDRDHGFWHWRQELVDNEHEVVDVFFNGAYDYWAAHVRCDDRLFSFNVNVLEPVS